MILFAFLLAAAPQITFQSSHLSSPELFAFSPDGHTVAAWTSYEPRVRVWDLDTFQLSGVFGNDEGASASFSSDGKVLSIGSRRFELATGAALERAEPFTQKPVEKPASSPLKDPQAWGFGAGGKLLLGASNDEIVVLDPATLAIRKRLPAPKPGETAKSSKVPLLPQVPGPQSARAAFVIVQGQVVHLDPITLAASRPVAFPEENAIPEVLIVRPDGNIAITAHSAVGRVHDNGTFTAFDAWTGALLFRFGGSQADPPAVTFTPQSHLVWASAAVTNGGVQIYQGQVTRVFDLGAAKELVSGPVMFGQLSPDGRFLVQDGANGPLQLCSLDTGAVQSVTHVDGSGQAPFTHRNDGYWSRDGRMYAARVGQGGYLIWDTAKATSPLSLLDQEKSTYEHPLFSPDNSLVAVAVKAKDYYGSDRIFRVYDLTTGKQFCEGKGVPLAFSRDGKQLALKGIYQEPDGELVDPWTCAALPPLSEKSLPGDFGDFFAFSERFEIDGFSQDLNIFMRRRKLARSPDGAVVALADGEGVLSFFDAASKKLRKQVTAHQGALLAMRFSPDSRRLLTYGSDRQTVLWDVAAGEKVATFIASEEQGMRPPELLTFTPEGYYFGQRAAVKMLAVRGGTRVFPIGQFDAWLNRPDIVLARLSGADAETVEYYRSAHERRLKKLGLSATPPALELPAVRVRREPLRASVNERHLAFEVEATPSGAPVTGFQIVANGVPLFDSKGTPAALVQGVQKLELDLAAGDNRLEVSAIDALGRESTPETMVIKLETPAAKPDLYVMAVGVSTYAQAQYSLQYAAKDAQDLLDGLGSAKGVKMMYGKLHLRAVVDGEVTREKVAAAAKELFAPAKVDDRVILFFAGHGLLDARAGYFFGTSDLDFENPAERGLSFDAMEALFSGLPARHRLMLVDTCAAGETDEDEVARASGAQPAPGVLVASRGVRKKGGPQLSSVKSQLLLTRELFSDLRRGSGASVIGSSSGVEYALESAELKNGVFTASLLETLHGLLGKEQVSLMEEMTPQDIEDAVSKKVLGKTLGQQHPVARETNLDDPFTVWRTTAYIGAEQEARMRVKRKKKK